MVPATPIPVPKVDDPLKIEWSDGPAGVRERLDAIDQIIGGASEVSTLAIDTVRGYVAEIMKMLKSNPAYDSILVDKDMHNVMLFVRSSVTLAKSGFETKSTKRTVKELKTAAAADFDLSNLMSPTPKAKSKANGSPAATGFDLSDIAAMDTTAITAKTRR